MNNIATLTQDSFTDEITSDVPVLVDFWAEWCAPCRALVPILDEIASENEGKIKIAKINVDENPDVSFKYSVMGLPTMILFVNGEEKVRLTGLRRKDQLLADLEGHLA